MLSLVLIALGTFALPWAAFEGSAGHERASLYQLLDSAQWRAGSMPDLLYGQLRTFGVFIPLIPAMAARIVARSIGRRARWAWAAAALTSIWVAGIVVIVQEEIGRRGPLRRLVADEVAVSGGPWVCLLGFMLCAVVSVWGRWIASQAPLD